MSTAIKTQNFLQTLKMLIVLVSIVYTWCVLLGLYLNESSPIKLMSRGRKRKSIFRYGLDYLTWFIKRLLDDKIYNILEFNDVTKFLSCT